MEIAKAFMRRQVKNCLEEDTNSGEWRGGPWKGNCVEQICSHVQGHDSTLESCSQTLLAQWLFKLQKRGNKAVQCYKKSLGIFNHANLTGIKRPYSVPSSSLNLGSCVHSMIGYTPHVCHRPTQGQGFNKSKQRRRRRRCCNSLHLSLLWRLCNALESPSRAPLSKKLCSMDEGHFGKWNGLQNVCGGKAVRPHRNRKLHFS